MTEIRIPFANPKADYQQHAPEIQKAVGQVMEKGAYILGAEVRRFEEAFASFFGASDCVSVNSGTDALVLALKALGLGPGDEVITVSHTAVATVAAIELTGATPVLADIKPDTYCLDPDLLETLVTPKTRAVIPVHLYGHPADMGAILAFARKYGLTVIEDCAQAHGAALNGKLVGSFGDLACFSFYPTKNLGAIGDGGAVLTSRPDLAKNLRLIREYGWEDRYISQVPGMNTRLDEIQAAILNVKLPHLLEKNQERQRIADIYDQKLAGTSFILPKRPAEIRHALHLYVIQTEKRDDLQAFLRSKGVGAGVHYPQAVHQQPAYLGRLPGCDRLPVTESLTPRILSLPIYPQLAREDVEWVCELLLEWERDKR